MRIPKKFFVHKIKFYSISFNAITLIVCFLVIVKLELLINVVYVELVFSFFSIHYESDEVDRKLAYEIFGISLKIILLYAFLLIARFILNKGSLKNLRAEKTKKKFECEFEGAIYKKISDKLINLVFDKNSNQLNSFKLFRTNYIFYTKGNIVGSRKSDLIFMIEHEVFHGHSYDTITKIFLLAVWPSFFVLLSLEILLSFTRLFIAYKWSYFFPFFYDSLKLVFYIYMLFMNQKFLMNFFHYKEHLADCYAYKVTKQYDALKMLSNQNSVWHPKSEDRIKYLINRSYKIKIDAYIYVICAVALVDKSRSIAIFLSASKIGEHCVVFVFLWGPVVALLLIFLYMLLLPDFYITKKCLYIVSVLFFINGIWVSTFYFLSQSFFAVLIVCSIWFLGKYRWP